MAKFVSKFVSKIVEFLKFVFNDVQVNFFITMTLFAITTSLYTKYAEFGFFSNLEDTLSFVFTSFTLGFFAINYIIVLWIKDYEKGFPIYTILVVIFSMLFLCLIVWFLEKVKIIKGSIWLFVIFFSYIAWIWIIYFSFCIRLLNSIDVECSVFIAISIKTILIAITAWLAIYRESQAVKYFDINLIIYSISLLYPILDMYKYVRLELNKYMEDNNNPIQIKSHLD